MQLKCLQREKSSGLCARVTLYVERLPDGTIRDAESGYVYPVSLSSDRILGWGELDGPSHVMLEGACHEYLVPVDSETAKRLLPLPGAARVIIRALGGNRYGVALGYRDEDGEIMETPWGQSDYDDDDLETQVLSHLRENHVQIEPDARVEIL